MNMVYPPAQKSRFLKRVERRYASYFSLLWDGPPKIAEVVWLIETLQSQFQDLGAALRVARQLILAQLVVLDCKGKVSLEQVSATMTQVAEVALEYAVSFARTSLLHCHGEPQNASGQMAQLAILGMGKLGARELNASSDIDLIYVYDYDGQTVGDVSGQNRISNQEFFAKMVRVIYGLIGEVTEHGFVFRIDIALRPNGNSGPSTLSLAALEEYFRVQGREWERFAWLKSRIVAPQKLIRSDWGDQLKNLVTPFVFRRYLDYGIFETLRQLHSQVREHVNKRSVGVSERQNDIKLGRGGIREIEFTVQLLQVVRGGQYPELRTRPTLKALAKLAKAQIMPSDIADNLAGCYIFLRRLEHFIQYLDDQQTHLLPQDKDDLLWVAQSMGFEGWEQLLVKLAQTRDFVAGEFDWLLGGHKAQATGEDYLKSVATDWQEVVNRSPLKIKERLSHWLKKGKFEGLSEHAQKRLKHLIERMSTLLITQQCTELAAMRFLDWMENIWRADNYLALLDERPQVLERLLRIQGLARWADCYLATHPSVIDELASDTLLAGRFNAVSFEAALHDRYKILSESGQDDEESLLNLLRRAHHGEVFRTLARDLEGVLTVEQVADDLSFLAISLLKVATVWCWERIKLKHCEVPHFGIIAYGKLGGLELGYGSDLDLVFVFNDESPKAIEIYAQLVRKLIHWLTVKTAEGDVYEIDTALRPNGNAGLLVTSFTMYANYQQQRGANTAWTWEHQAMTRASCVLGSEALCREFSVVRQGVLMARRDVEQLRAEIIAMRQKMLQNQRFSPELFDVKNSPGGMIDIEFVVQFLVLGYAHQYPELTQNIGNTALLLLAGKLGLLAQNLAQEGTNAYRKFRQIQHQARLNEAQPQLEKEHVAHEANIGYRLWTQVLVNPSD